MNNLPNRPVILDIDRSVGPLADRLVLPLEHWQESIRYGCSLATMRRFHTMLDQLLPVQYGTVFMGSGDFHHLSWPLIARLQPRTPFQVVVLDNHPDNMRFPFGVHCGSWVRKVAALPQVGHVHVVGITSPDIGRGHAWENYLTPLLRGRLSYWSIGVDVSWAHRLGLGHAFHNFDDPQSLITGFGAWQRQHPLPTYLSIDKDAFAANVARTNWDQGQLQLADALALIDNLQGKLVGSDINGEVSLYHYQSWWKRKLSAIDEQPAIDAQELAGWQAQQHALNLQLLPAIAARS